MKSRGRAKKKKQDIYANLSVLKILLRDDTQYGVDRFHEKRLAI